MEDVFWSLADEDLLADLLSALNLHLHTEPDPKIKSLVFAAQIELSWYCKSCSVEIYTVKLKDAALLAKYWQEIASRLQQLVSDRFFLAIAQGYPDNFQTLLIKHIKMQRLIT